MITIQITYHISHITYKSLIDNIKYLMKLVTALVAQGVSPFYCN